MKVLVPIDDSPASINTLSWIVETLDKQNTQYHLLHVIPKTFSEIMEEENQVEKVVRFLTERKWFLESKGCTVERAEYVLGDPIEAICRYADEVNADQVLLGSFGNNTENPDVVGQVSRGVMERCKQPVFIFRNHHGLSDYSKRNP